MTIATEACTLSAAEPLGTTSTEALACNSSTLDKILNSEEEVVTNRVGNNLTTITGALNRLGYSAPIAYEAGISFSSQDKLKTISRPDDTTPTSSIQYAPHPTQLPFTTTGDWNIDSGKFFVVQGVTREDQIEDLSIAYQVGTSSELLADAILFPAGKIIDIEDRKGGSFIYTIGGTPNGFEVLDAGNGNTAVAQLTTPIIDTHVGIRQSSGDSYLALKNAQDLAIVRNTQVVLTVRGTYRTSADLDLNIFTGIGWITLDGWTHNNIVDRNVINDTRPLMIENSADAHVGGEGNYTAFFGGVSFQGTKLFVARNGDDHISFPTKVAKYTVSENNEITKGVLLDELGSEMTFHDFRDPNLSVQRSLSQGVILSGSELTSTPLVYQHYFMSLSAGEFNVVTRYNVDAFPSDEFMWGNAVQSPNENWLKCTYGVTGSKLNNVFLYRATTDGSDPVAWTKIQDPLFENASECTLCYYQDKLVAITRSEPQTNGLQMRWTYDLEGLTGWSDSSFLPFTGAAPAVIQYIPEGDPIFLHFSELDTSTGYRMPTFAATYDLVDWTRQSTGQFRNNTGSGAYGGLVPDGKGSYSTMYYEEVGATEGVTRVWYGSMNLEGRVYPNDSTVNFLYSQDKNIQKSAILPSGEACLGSPSDITNLITSDANASYFEIIPKIDIDIRSVVMMMADNTATDVSVTVTEDGVNIGTSSVTSVESINSELYDFPISLTLSTGKLYRFTVSGSVRWFGRRRPAYYNSPYRGITDDYTYYSYVKTFVEGSNVNTHVMSHGFKI